MTAETRGYCSQSEQEFSSELLEEDCSADSCSRKQLSGRLRERQSERGSAPELGRHPQTNRGFVSKGVETSKNNFFSAMENVVSALKTVIPEMIDKAKKTYKEQIKKSQLGEMDDNE